MKRVFYLVGIMFMFLTSCSEQKTKRESVLLDLNLNRDSVRVEITEGRIYLPTVTPNKMDENNPIYDYSTHLSASDSILYLVSRTPLTTANINLGYKSRCIYSKGFGYYRDRNNIGLNFLKEDNGKYYYSAPFYKWVSGYFDELEYMLVLYNNGIERDYITANQVYLSKEDVSNLLKPFAAYLILR